MMDKDLVNIAEVYMGSSVTNRTEPLSAIPLDELYERIKNPTEDYVSLIKQLRNVRMLDKKKYDAMKRNLPYIVCAKFNPPYRNTENFVHTNFFIVDIDHITEKNLSVDAVREIFKTDMRTVMMFMSPGEDGLKVVFRLKEKCCDPGLYSIFYKKFVSQLSDSFSLEQVIDTKTSDVARACFISYDKDVYYNPNAESVDIEDFLNLDDPVSISDDKRIFDIAEKKIQNAGAVGNEDAEEKRQNISDPDAETIGKIKEKLKLKKVCELKPEPKIPEQLRIIIPDIIACIEENGLTVTETISMPYAKKIRVCLGRRQAEVSVYYGKRGYTVVESPRSGTDPELNGIAAELIRDFVDGAYEIRNNKSSVYAAEENKTDRLS